MYTRLIASLLVLSLLGLSIPRLNANSAAGPAVVINELMWMGSSLSANDEWIELRNTTDNPVDLSGWFLSKKSGGTESVMLIIPDGSSVPARGFFLIANYGADLPTSTLGIQPDLVDTDVSLVNSALQVTLYDATSALIDAADDGSGAPLGGHYESGAVWQSMERVATVGDGTQKESWRTASTAVNFDVNAPELGTPRAPNGNSAPVAEAGPDLEAGVDEVVSFDGSESVDVDNDPLSFAWSFGDGAVADGPTPTHRFDEPGSFTATLTVSDGLESSSDSLLIEVREEDAPKLPNDPNPSQPPRSPQQPALPDDPAKDGKPKPRTAKIVLNEFFPNPDGRDQDSEFIELFNQESVDVPLIGWSLTDGKKAYRFPDTARIDGQGFFVVTYAMSHLLLRNSGSEFQLVDPNGRVVNGVAYSEAPNGLTFARVDGADRWDWTSEITPGSENEFAQTNSEPSSTGGGSVNINASDEAEAGSAPRDSQVSELSDLPTRSLVRVSGTVAVAPGQFSSTTFWIVDDEGLGAEISSSAKAFSALQIGDQVRLVGRTSEAGIARRVNLQKDGLERIGSGQVVEPADRAIADLTDDAVGSFVVVEGVVGERQSAKFTLLDDDGQELIVALKRGTKLNATALTKGQSVRVAGILGSSSGQLQLWPRVKDDISTSGEVLGASEDQTEVTTANLALDQPKKVSGWMVLGVIGAMLVAGGYFYIRHRRKDGTESVQ
jgi:PKD repeat protein